MSTEVNDAVDRQSSIRSMNSVLTTLRVFEEVAMQQPIGVSELARATQIPKSSVQRCLVTLQQAGWLRIVDPERARWGVTMKALVLGLRGAGEQDLRDLAGPIIKRLSLATDETVHFALRDGNDSVILARVDTTKDLRVILEVGTRLPLQATSAGAAILAKMDPADVDQVLRRKVASVEGAPVPSAADLRAEIDRTAERGYSLNVSAWFRPYVSSIGAAVTNASGQPVAAIVLSIPEMRYDPAREQEQAALVLEAAKELSDLLSSV